MLPEDVLVFPDFFFAVWWEHADAASLVILVLHELLRVEKNSIQRLAEDVDKAGALLDAGEHELGQVPDALDHSPRKYITRHAIYLALLAGVLQPHAVPLQFLRNVVEYFLGSLSDLRRQFLQELLRLDIVALVVRAEVIFIPGFRVTAVAAAADVALQLHPVPLMVALLEALLADDARWVFLAIEAAPRDIAGRQLFGADSRLTILVNLSQKLRIVALLT